MKTIYLALTFCIGLVTGYLLFDSSDFNKEQTESFSETAKEKSIQINNQKVLSEIALRKQNNLLSGQLQIASHQITAGKQALFTERAKVKKLLLQSQSASSTDTVVKRELVSLDTLNRITDSLISGYEAKLSVTDSLVGLRDSQLVVCDQAYQQMKNLVDEQTERERQLKRDLSTALKQQKRKRIQSRILAVGLLFVSGITTSLLIKTNK